MGLKLTVAIERLKHYVSNECCFLFSGHLAPSLLNSLPLEIGRNWTMLIFVLLLPMGT